VIPFRVMFGFFFLCSCFAVATNSHLSVVLLVPESTAGVMYASLRCIARVGVNGRRYVRSAINCSHVTPFRIAVDRVLRFYTFKFYFR
jgi:hypothetical protein